MTEGRFVMGDREIAQISAYCEIARVNESLLNLREVLEATSIDATEDELRIAWETTPSLTSKYRLDRDWVLDRGPEGIDSTEEEAENRKRSQRNMEVAREFAASCADDRVVLMAVGGGNSYGSARPRDDIDFFTVTANDSVWTFMLRTLVLARIHRLTAGRHAPLCLSYVVEERTALREFERPRDALFARDALMADVVAGREYYRNLLLRSAWIASYYPRLYAKRTRTSRPSADRSRRRRGNPVLNSILFYTLGMYVRLKAYLLNRRLLAGGKSSATFRADLGKDRCIYESRKYVRLRWMYARLDGANKP